jgi:hypothetical protein
MPEGWSVVILGGIKEVLHREWVYSSAILAALEALRGQQRYDD